MFNMMTWGQLKGAADSRQPQFPAFNQSQLIKVIRQLPRLLSVSVKGIKKTEKYLIDSEILSQVNGPSHLLFHLAETSRSRKHWEALIFLVSISLHNPI